MILALFICYLHLGFRWNTLLTFADKKPQPKGI
jgi:hypothetical protein